LFVCYFAVTALTELSAKMRSAPRRMAAKSRACDLRVQLGRRPITPAETMGFGGDEQRVDALAPRRRDRHG
jgi:hypothetical protein